ncbi:retrotransposon gag domain-containing protein, partial [Corynebacterium sp. MC-02]|nr:retrotransposon gag domain-containing protein [Corynebacterium pseudokroppenstedtii]
MASNGNTAGGSQTGGGAQNLDQHHVPLVHDPMEQPPVVTRAETDPAPAIEVRGAPLATLTENEQRCYEMFRKMNPPQFQGGRNEDAHEFLTTCKELLDTVGLAESHGVRYVTLQLRGPAREWWRTYSGSLPVGSPTVSWEMFSSAFYDRFIPWSVREESRLKFESLRQEGLSVIEYETHFCQLSRHAITVIPNEAEKVHRFVRGLTYS